MHDSIKLKLDILNFWHAGTGMSAGTRVDAMIARDEAGLPYLPGRTLKGLLRDAFFQAQNWGWLKETDSQYSVVELLFGSRGSAQENERTVIEPGMLALSDATLSAEEKAWLSSEVGKPSQSLLVKDVFSTAIQSRGEKAGVALESSLRGIEVAIPLTLLAEVNVELPVYASGEFAQAQQAWLTANDIASVIKEVLPLIDSIGSMRNRGYGKTVVTIEGGH